LRAAPGADKCAEVSRDLVDFRPARRRLGRFPMPAVSSRAAFSASALPGLAHIAPGRLCLALTLRVVS
jgi:hypothetical protein